MARSKCVLTAVRSSSVTLPLVGDKVGQVVVEQHAGGPGVAPVVHLAAPEGEHQNNHRYLDL